MLYLQRVPKPPLADFVDVLWLYDGFSVPHARERLLPTGTVELVVNLREDQPDFRRPVVAGPHSRPSLLDTAHTASVMGAHFRPGGAFPFLGLPAGELHNLEVSLDTLWGARAEELRERILAAPAHQARLDVLEAGLLSAARRAARHPAVAFAVRELSAVPGLLRVGEVVEAVGLSQRAFIERFRREVGLAPKLFARVMRFQEVVRRVHPARQVDWSAVALACGYYDQAHFINDFRELSGLTPADYLVRKSTHQNHVPLTE